MTPKENLQLAAKVADYVNDITPLGINNYDVAEIMLLAMQGLIGVKGTANIITDRAPKEA